MPAYMIVEVETTDGVKFSMSLHKIRYERPPLRVGSARQISFRLVEENMYGLLIAQLGIDQLSVDLDVIRLGVRFGTELGDDLTVHGHHARRDELFRSATGRDPGLGDQFL